MNTAVTGAGRELASCHLCYKLAPATLHHCPRCGSALHLRKSDSIQRTLALLATACLLYIPANLYPIMYTDQLGSTEASTILGGVVNNLLLHLTRALQPVQLAARQSQRLQPIGRSTDQGLIARRQRLQIR